MIQRSHAFVAAIALALAVPAQPSPAKDGASALPVGAAVAAREKDGERVYLADFATGDLQPIGGRGSQMPQQPIWSPDGANLAYRVGTQLWLHSEHAKADSRVFDALERETQHPYAFRPDGLQLAVAAKGAVILVDLDTRGTPRLLLKRPQARVGDLLWSADGDTLAAMFWPVKVPEQRAGEVVRVSLADGSSHSQSVPRLSRLLGWRGRDLLVVQTATKKQVALLPPDGLPSVLFQPNLAILDYAQAADQLLLAEYGEDAGDALILFLAPPTRDAKPQRWLASHPGFSRPRLSPDGSSALFIERARSQDGHGGGSVYLVPVGSESPRLVLKATAARTFTEAVPRVRRESK